MTSTAALVVSAANPSMRRLHLRLSALDSCPGVAGQVCLKTLGAFTMVFIYAFAFLLSILRPQAPADLERRARSARFCFGADTVLRAGIGTTSRTREETRYFDCGFMAPKSCSPREPDYQRVPVYPNFSVVTLIHAPYIIEELKNF